jgi:hypothetical protein
MKSTSTQKEKRDNKINQKTTTPPHQIQHNGQSSTARPDVHPSSKHAIHPSLFPIRPSNNTSTSTQL